MAHLHAGLPDRRGIDDRYHLLQMLDQQAVEQGLVAILEAAQVDEALQIFGFALVGLVGPAHLGVQLGDPGPQHAVDPQAEPLLLLEGGGLVEERITQQLPTPGIDLVVVLTGQWVDLERERLHACPFPQCSAGILVSQRSEPAGLLSGASVALPGRRRNHIT